MLGRDAAVVNRMLRFLAEQAILVQHGRQHPEVLVSDDLAEVLFGLQCRGRRFGSGLVAAEWRLRSVLSRQIAY
jgi:hypothetical protein